MWCTYVHIRPSRSFPLLCSMALSWGLLQMEGVTTTGSGTGTDTAGTLLGEAGTVRRTTGAGVTLEEGQATTDRVKAEFPPGLRESPQSALTSCGDCAGTYGPVSHTPAACCTR